jgi:hypothetical protein
LAEVCADAGFAAVDALVALMILAATLMLSLQALTIAGKAASASHESRAAMRDLRRLWRAQSVDRHAVPIRRPDRAARSTVLLLQGARL